MSLPVIRCSDCPNLGEPVVQKNGEWFRRCKILTEKKITKYAYNQPRNCEHFPIDWFRTKEEKKFS